MRSSCARSRFSLSGSSSRYQPATAPVNLPPSLAPPPPGAATGRLVRDQPDLARVAHPTDAEPAAKRSSGQPRSLGLVRPQGRVVHLVTRPYHPRVRQVTWPGDVTPAGMAGRVVRNVVRAAPP